MDLTKSTDKEKFVKFAGVGLAVFVAILILGSCTRQPAPVIQQAPTYVQQPAPVYQEPQQPVVVQQDNNISDMAVGMALGSMMSGGGHHTTVVKKYYSPKRSYYSSSRRSGGYSRRSFGRRR